MKRPLIITGLLLAMYLAYKSASGKATAVTYTTAPNSGNSTQSFVNNDQSVELDVTRQIVGSNGSKGFEFQIFTFDATQNKLISQITDTIVAGDQSYTVQLPDALHVMVVTNNNNGTVTFNVYTQHPPVRLIFSQTLTYQGGAA